MPLGQLVSVSGSCLRTGHLCGFGGGMGMAGQKLLRASSQIAENGRANHWDAPNRTRPGSSGTTGCSKDGGACVSAWQEVLGQTSVKLGSY